MKIISSKAKRIIIIIAVIIVLLGIPISKALIRNYRITNELTAIAESRGLKDVKIHIGGKIKDYDFYDVTVDSSNLEDLTYSQMYSLASSMHSDDAFISKYTSNGNAYEIFPSSKLVYKNGSQIHDGYWYSQSYASATENDNKSNYSSSSSSSSFTPYKSPDKSYDKYHAKDYSDEEDFYEDHYDDFFDYYDAEQYYRDHKD